MFLGVRALGVVVVVAAVVGGGHALPGIGTHNLLTGPPMHQVDMCILTCDYCYKVSTRPQVGRQIDRWSGIKKNRQTGRQGVDR